MPLTKNKNTKLRHLAFKHLLSAHYRSIGDDTASSNYKMLDLYHRFLVSGVEEKGAYNYLYSEKGVEGKLNLQFNFGNFIIPFLNLSIKSGVALSGSEILTPVVARSFTKTLFNPDQQDAIRWFNHNIISYLVLTGKSFKTTLEGEAEIGITFEADTNLLTVDTVEFGAGANLSAKAGTEIHLAFSNEDAPRWYRSAMNWQLIADFSGTLADGQIRYITEQFSSLYKTRLAPLIDLNQLNDDLRDKLNQVFNRRFQNLYYKIKTTKQIKSISDLINELYTYSLNHDLSDSVVKNGILKLELENYHSKLEDATKADQSGAQSREPGPYAGFCFLDYTIISPETELAGNLNLALAATKGEAKISRESHNQSISSRFQTFSECTEMGSILVMTQDTIINYKETKISAEASGQLLPDSISKKVGLQKNKKEWNTEFLFKNSMHYSAATCYWLNYATKDRFEENQKIHLEPGSGISYGLSIRFSALFEMAKDLNAGGEGNEETNTNLTFISGALKIEKQELKSFLEHLFFEDDLDQDSSKAFPQLMGEQAIISEVLLEAAFSYKTNDTLPEIKTTKASLRTRNSISNYTKKGEYKELFKNNATASTLRHEVLQLESIRLRIRLADKLDNPDRDSIFSLGFSLFQTGFKLGMDRIKDWGNEGIFTFHIQFFTDEENNTNRIPITGELNEHDRREAAVPPVFFPPHS